jgi:hypothetical protein
MLVNFSSPAFAETENATKIACKKKVTVLGRPKLIESVAKLDALRVWHQAVTDEFDKDHAMWHNAKTRALKCNMVGKKRVYYKCAASGRPCLLVAVDTISPNK